MIQIVQDVKVAVGLSERLQTGLTRSSRQPLRNHSHLQLRISTTTQTQDQLTWSRLWSLKQTKKVCSARGHEVSAACLSRPLRVKPGALNALWVTDVETSGLTRKFHVCPGQWDWLCSSQFARDFGDQ